MGDWLQWMMLPFIVSVLWLNWRLNSCCALTKKSFSCWPNFLLSFLQMCWSCWGAIHYLMATQLQFTQAAIFMHHLRPWLSVSSLTLENNLNMPSIMLCWAKDNQNAAFQSAGLSWIPNLLPIMFTYTITDMVTRLARYSVPEGGDLTTGNQIL